MGLRYMYIRWINIAIYKSDGLMDIHIRWTHMLIQVFLLKKYSTVNPGWCLHAECRSTYSIKSTIIKFCTCSFHTVHAMELSGQMDSHRISSYPESSQCMGQRSCASQVILAVAWDCSGKQLQKFATYKNARIPIIYNILGKVKIILHTLNFLTEKFSQ